MNAMSPSAAVAAVYRRANYTPTPTRRGPVPLHEMFESHHLMYTAVPDLSLASAAELLLRERYLDRPALVADLLVQKVPLVGLLFRVGTDALAFVTANDMLPRRRFTAAHELGHAVLHADELGQYLADESIHEDGKAHSQREREADQFAAELLMPAVVLHARADEMHRRHRVCPRLVLAYQLAAELLVSRQSIHYRLKTLEVGDE
jgi:hypothetical protein